MYKKLSWFMIFLMGLLFVGCSSSPKVKTTIVDKSYRYHEAKNNPINFRYNLVVGTKQPDTKVMIDNGEWAKIWIKNYRNKNKTFVTSHSIITMIREPGFIAGEQIPRRRRDTVSNTYGGRSFTFRSQDLIYDNSSYGSENVSDEQIKEYMNNYEYSKKTRRMRPQKIKESLVHDKVIKEYVKMKKTTQSKGKNSD